MKVSTILIFAPSVMALAIPNPISRTTATVEKRQFDFVGDFVRNIYKDMNDFAMNLLPPPKIQGLPYGEHNVVPAPPKN